MDVFCHRPFLPGTSFEPAVIPTAQAYYYYYYYYYYLLQIGLSPGGSGYFTCIQNMKLVTIKFKSGGLHEKHVVATWNVGNRLSICFWAQGNQEKPVSRWPVAGPSEY